jgi:2-hydroxycyclohexanecarboxyl-CoA dehydrogenase
VLVPAVIPCGECDLCKRGKETICRAQYVPGCDTHGGFATHVKILGYGLCAVDEPKLAAAGLELADVSVVADALTTPYQAVFQANLKEGDLAVVVGVGGIGGYCVQVAAAFGTTVYMGDLNAECGEQAAQEIRTAGGKAKFITLDITDDTSITAFKDRIIDQSGRLDVLANVAGWGHTEYFAQSSPAGWNKEIDINLKGPMKMYHAFLPGMFEQTYGRIVNVSSDAGRVGSLAETVYAAAKGGQIAFTKALAREGARHKVAVNCICPGPTETPLLADTAENIQQALKKRSPCGASASPARLPTPSCFSPASGPAIAPARCSAYRAA